MLRYEDLMLTPISTMVNLFTHLRLEFDIAAADALYNHTRGMVENKNRLNQYYSTYRTADFDIYKWKKELTLSKIRLVEKNCGEFLKYAGYSIYKSPERQNSTKTQQGTKRVNKRP